MDRTPVLRSSMMWDGIDEPLQVVYRRVEVPVTYGDWRGLGAQDRDREVQRLLIGDRAQGFDLALAPLLRVHLARLSDTEVQVVLIFHHVLLDGWSLAQVLSDVFACHAALTRADNTAATDLTLPSRRPFRDYVEWLRRQDSRLAEEHWRGALAGMERRTPLPYDQAPTQAYSTTSSQWLSTGLSDKDSAGLIGFAQRHGLTLNAVVQGAWAVLLSRYSGERDVCFGATVSGRPAELPGVEDITGIFINTLPVRVDVGGETRTADWLQKLHAAQAEFRRFEHLPLPQLQAWTDVPGGVHLFDSIVVFENYPINDEAAATHGLAIRNLEAVETTNYPLTVVVSPGRQLSIELGYDPALFNTQTITRLATHLQALLQGIADNGDLPVRDLPMLTQAEIQQILVEWTDTGHEVEVATLPKLLEAQTARTPDAMAVICEDVSLTYAHLNARVNRLARLLIERGAGPEQFVALALPRSLEMIIAMLAVLKSGAAYVPIDLNYPFDRITFMLADTRPVLVVTTSEVVDRLPVGNQLVLDQADVIAAQANYADTNLTDGDRLWLLSVDSPAYVIYTSGSTGQPKGVVVTHRSVCNYLLWAAQAYPSLQGCAVLHSPVSFDLTVTTLYGPLLVGGSIRVTELVEEQSDLNSTPVTPCTFLKATPSHLALLKALPDAFSPTGDLVVGGEQLVGEILDGWRRTHPSATVINEYGP
ncbi:MAG TPA: condensation domain-containing protein, partial [Pseudonocardiaceae bacterium]